MKVGKVFLVGAGPGDPGLMTVRGAELIRSADKIVMDALVNAEVVVGARGEVIDAGKRGRTVLRPGHGPKQAMINRLLIRLARAGHSVVRLKGGDPFVFGRGSEEIEALRDAGIPYEVVSGVSSAVAAPAYAGIPVTDRRWASQVTFITGHESAEKHDGGVDWDRLSPEGTLVVLMGVTGWPSVAPRLVARGWKKDTPVAAIERATTPRQRVVSSTLGRSAKDFLAARLVAPSVVVVGAVAGLSKRLGWFPRERPLLGRRVAVTRATDQADGLNAALRAEGAAIVRCPLIAVRPIFSEGMKSVLEKRDRFDWLVFLSANGVRHFTGFLSDRRWLRNAKVAAVGPQTADAAAQAGWTVDRVPDRFDSAGVRAALGSVRGRRILVPRGLEAPDDLIRALQKAGARVTVAPVYETHLLVPTPEEKSALLNEAEAVTFMSASSARAFFSAFSPAERRRLFSRATAVSIGDMTTRELRLAGVKNRVQAASSSRFGVVDALRRLFRAK